MLGVLLGAWRNKIKRFQHNLEAIPPYLCEPEQVCEFLEDFLYIQGDNNTFPAQLLRCYKNQIQ